MIILIKRVTFVIFFFSFKQEMAPKPKKAPAAAKKARGAESAGGKAADCGLTRAPLEEVGSARRHAPPAPRRRSSPLLCFRSRGESASP